MKIGIFGGSFDPIHWGHIRVADFTLQEYDLSKILFIPANKSPYKQHLQTESSEHRLALIKLAIANHPQFDLDVREINREGISYTFETIKSLKKERKNDQFYLLIGDDHLQSFTNWYNWRDILSASFLISFRKTGDSLKIPTELSDYKDRILLSKAPFYDISSTMIRQAVIAGHTISNHVPVEVSDYIQKHNLYRSQEF